MLGNCVISCLTAAAIQTASQAAVNEDAIHHVTIVVTGERVRRSTFETPTSVEVFGKAQIESVAGADRIEHILEMVPNVQISSGGEGPTIRGQDTTGPARDLPAFLGGSRPRATLIVDGRPVSFNEFVFGAAPLWDVDRVEVFRSPQTTTQGQNSIAGAIFIETSDPSSTPEWRARGIGGSFATRQLSLSATGPVTEDVAVRLAGDLRYSHTSSKLADRIDGADPNHEVYGLFRVKLLARPSNSARLELSLSHSQSQMPQIEGVRPPFKRRRDPGATYGTFRTNVDSGTASLSLSLSNGLDLNAVATAGDTNVRRFAPPGLGEIKVHGRDWLVETVLNWAPASAFRATAGASFRRARQHQFIDLSQLSGIGQFGDMQQATGLFGEATWSLTTRLNLTAGLRYQHDRQVREGALAGNTAPIALDFRRSFDAWLPKLSLAYDLKKEIRVGFIVQRAYNPGGTTLRFDTGQPDNFGAESLWDYEVFVRASFVDAKLTGSANFFRYDMTNPQRARSIVIVAPTSSLVTFADLFNVEKARSQGADLSIQWRPNPNLSTKLAIGLLRARIIRAEGLYSAFEDKDFQRSPRFSLAAAADWRALPRIMLSARIRHNSGFFSDDLNQEARRVRGWTKIDAEASYEGDRFRIFGYARNVLNKFYLTYFLSPTWATAGDPREFGIGLEARIR